MFFEPYVLGKKYVRLKHTDCGQVMDMPAYQYPKDAYWACPCGWFGTLLYMLNNKSQWCAGHCLCEPEITEEGRMVWVDKEGERYTATLPPHWLYLDGTIVGGGRWEPF